MFRIQPRTSKAVVKVLLNRRLPSSNKIQKCHSSLMKEAGEKMSKSQDQSMFNGHVALNSPILKPRKLPDFSMVEAPEKKFCNAKNDSSPSTDENTTKASASKKKKLSYTTHKDIAKAVEQLSPFSSSVTAKVYMTSAVMPELRPQSTSSSAPKTQPLTQNVTEPKTDIIMKATIASTNHSKPELKSEEKFEIENYDSPALISISVPKAKPVKKLEASVAPPKQTAAILQNSPIPKEKLVEVSAAISAENTPVENLSIKNTEYVVLKNADVLHKNEFVETFPTTKKPQTLQAIKPDAQGSSTNLKADSKSHNNQSKTHSPIAQLAPKISKVQKTPEPLGHHYIDQGTDNGDKVDILKVALPADSNVAKETEENNTTDFVHEVELEELMSFSKHLIKKPIKGVSEIPNSKKLASNENVMSQMKQIKTSRNEINTETSGIAQDVAMKKTLQGIESEIKIMNDTLKSMLQTFSDDKFVVQLQLSNIIDLRDLLQPLPSGDFIHSTQGKANETENPKEAIGHKDDHISDVASQHSKIKNDNCQSLKSNAIQIAGETRLQTSFKLTLMYLIQSAITNSLLCVKTVVQKIVKTIKIPSVCDSPTKQEVNCMK